MATSLPGSASKGLFWAKMVVRTVRPFCINIAWETVENKSEIHLGFMTTCLLTKHVDPQSCLQCQSETSDQSDF